MKVDQLLMDTTPRPLRGEIADHPARLAEEIGYDGIWLAETAYDPFFPLLLTAQSTDRIEVGTAVAVAFARNPMTVATIANDLQAYSGGRFILGLGSQIRPHITKRFSMRWSDKPAVQMREFIRALKAIWRCWNTGETLDFKGEYYTHTLMTPFFTPEPNPFGEPRVMLAGVGPYMTRVAGEVCDGFICHGFTTEQYFREVTLPSIEEGLTRAGRSLDDFEIAIPSFIVTGTDEKEMAESAKRIRHQIAFYGSTPVYKPVLDTHGWGDLQGELNRLTKEGRWDEIDTLIDDEVLNAFAVVAEPEQIAQRWGARWGGLVDRLSFRAPFRSDPERWGGVLASLKEL